MALSRIAEVLIPLLRDGLGTGVKVGSSVEDVDFRTYPMINLRRIGGPRDPKHPDLFSSPVVQMEVIGNVGDLETEQLYEDALDVLFTAVRRQKVTPAGHLSSMNELTGATDLASPYEGTWLYQGLIQFGLRPPTQ